MSTRIEAAATLPTRSGTLLGMPVAKRVPDAMRAGVHHRGYLSTKAKRSGHLIDASLLGEAP